MGFQPQRREFLLDINSKDLVAGATLIRHQQDGDQPTDDDGVRIRQELPVRTILVRNQPDSGRATAHQMGIRLQARVQRGQLLPHFHDHPVPVFPVIQQGECFRQFRQAVGRHEFFIHS